MKDHDTSKAKGFAGGNYFAGMLEKFNRDRDGMPDAWERGHGLNPKDPGDRNRDRDGDGYTNLEEYLNSLCPNI